MTGEFHDEKHRGYLLVTVDGPRATIEWKAMIEEGGTTVWKALDVSVFPPPFAVTGATAIVVVG